MKICTRCGIEKPESEFHKQKQSKDGLKSHCKICRRAWCEANKEKVKACYAEWYQANKAYYPEWRKNNKDKIRAYHRKRLKTDPLYKLKRNLRIRLCDALKGKLKSAATMKLVGCTLVFLKAHIESQFKPGMTWDNHGHWHVDHIRPCSSFNLSDPEQQRLCFHYSNLQPLWAEENLSKSDSIQGVQGYLESQKIIPSV
jgi:hypothetical protein